MLMQLLTQHPEAIVSIVRNTPAWVWGLLAALVALGGSQLRDRNASLVRVSVMPVALTLFSLYGTLSALGGSPLLPQAMATWAAAAGLASIAIAFLAVDARYDAASRMYALRGSVVPLLLILAVFMVKYAVGIELTMAPARVQDGPFVLTVAALYGAFSGIFVGRATRLWRLALRTTAPAALAA